MTISEVLDLRKGVCVIAEVGNNHDGDIECAKELVKKAAEAGVDVIKFQAFNTEEWFSKTFPAFARAKPLGYEMQFDRLKAVELSIDDLHSLADLARENGLKFLVTPLDDESVDIVDPLVDFFKVASGDLINPLLLKKIKSMGKPVILSSGQATPDEIEKATTYFSPEQTALLHCVSSYPTPDHAANLRSITALQKKYPNYEIGYSDHTVGTIAAVSAVALGARIVEKHFTHDRTRDYGDHPLSADYTEMKELVAGVRRVEKMLGSEDILCLDAELGSRKELRRTIHAKHSLAAGVEIREQDLIGMISEKPGICISKLEEVVGKTLLRDMTSKEIFSEDYFS